MDYSILELGRKNYIITCADDILLSSFFRNLFKNTFDIEIISKINTTEKPTLVALDARKNCAYLYLSGEIKGAVQLDEIKEIIAKNDYFVITDDKLQQNLGGISYQQGEYQLGEILAQLTFEKLKSGKTKWQELKPLYIQPPGVGGNVAHLVK